MEYRTVYICYRPLAPVVLLLTLFGFACLTGGKNALVFILSVYGPVPLRMRVFHSGKWPVYICFGVVLCLMSVVVGAGFLADGGGPIFRLYVVFSGGGGLAERGRLSKLGLGSGCSGPFGCPVGFVWRSVFW